MKQYVVDAFTDRIFHGNQAAARFLDTDTKTKPAENPQAQGVDKVSTP